SRWPVCQNIVLGAMPPFTGTMSPGRRNCWRSCLWAGQNRVDRWRSISRCETRSCPVFMIPNAAPCSSSFSTVTNRSISLADAAATHNVSVKYVVGDAFYLQADPPRISLRTGRRGIRRAPPPRRSVEASSGARLRIPSHSPRVAQRAYLISKGDFTRSSYASKRTSCVCLLWLREQSSSCIVSLHDEDCSLALQEKEPDNAISPRIPRRPVRSAFSGSECSRSLSPAPHLSA